LNGQNQIQNPKPKHPRKSKNQNSNFGIGSWDFLWILDLEFRFPPPASRGGRRPERTLHIIIYTSPITPLPQDSIPPLIYYLYSLINKNMRDNIHIQQFNLNNKKSG